MKLLLDTHTLLWFIGGSTRISSRARGLIEDLSNERFFSVASLWEIAIKTSIGKLELFSPFEDVFPAQLDDNGIELLNIRLEHTAQVAVLPHLHRDPFDRLLIAQAMLEEMTIVGADSAFDAYPITRLW